MRNYVVTAPAVNFPAGSVLALDKDQHRRRRHQVVDPGKTDLADLKIDARAIKERELTVAVTRAPVMFKHGETVAVIEAPGVNFDRISEIAVEGSEEAEEARNETAARAEASAGKTRASRRPAKEKASAKPAGTSGKGPGKAEAASPDPAGNDAGDMAGGAVAGQQPAGLDV